MHRAPTAHSGGDARSPWPSPSLSVTPSADPGRRPRCIGTGLRTPSRQMRVALKASGLGVVARRNATQSRQMHGRHRRLIVGGCRRCRIPAKGHVSTYLCRTSPRPPRTAYSGHERLWHINPKYWLYSVSLLISEGGLDQETGRRTSLASKQFPQIRTTDRAGVPSLGGREVIPRAQ